MNLSQHRVQFSPSLVCCRSFWNRKYNGNLGRVFANTLKAFVQLHRKHDDSVEFVTPKFTVQETAPCFMLSGEVCLAAWVLSLLASTLL